jgi:LEA14-like dessication related protein
MNTTRYYKNIAIKTFLLALVFILPSCYSWQEVEVGDVEEVKFKGLVDNHLLLEILVPVKNPNNREITVTEMYLDIYLNGEEFGNVLNTKDIMLAPGSDEVYTLPVEIEITGLKKGIMSFIGILQDRVVDMELKGYVVASSGIMKKKFPVDEKHNLN